MTDFNWLQKCTIDKDDCFMSDDRVFHSDGPATEKLRGPKPTVLVLGILSGHLDLPTVGGDVLTLPKLERSLTRGTGRQAGVDICRREDRA